MLMSVSLEDIAASEEKKRSKAKLSKEESNLQVVLLLKWMNSNV